MPAREEEGVNAAADARLTRTRPITKRKLLLIVCILLIPVVLGALWWSSDWRQERAAKSALARCAANFKTLTVPANGKSEVSFEDIQKKRAEEASYVVPAFKRLRPARVMPVLLERAQREVTPHAGTPDQRAARLATANSFFDSAVEVGKQLIRGATADELAVYERSLDEFAATGRSTAGHGVVLLTIEFLKGEIAASRKVQLVEHLQESRNTHELVQLLSDLDTSGDASRALISIGPPAVPDICRAIEDLPPAFDTEADVNLLTAGTVTLAMIAKETPSTMTEALPCLFDVARRASNKKARTLIVLHIQLFHPKCVPHLMAYLNSVTQDPPPDDPTTTTTQHLVSWAIINMVENDPQDVEPVIKELEKCLRQADDKEKLVIIFQIANLSHTSHSVIALLEEELKSADDPDYRKQVEEALKRARANADK